MGFDGPIDIDHSAIHNAMRLYKIKDKKVCFEKNLIMASYWINSMRKKG